MKSSSRVVGLLVALVAGAPASAAPAFFEGVFSPAQWVTIQTLGAGGQNYAHQASGGNPGDYFRVETTTDSAVEFAHFNTAFVLDPALTPLEAIAYSIEVRNYLVSGQGMTFTLILEQGGSIFAAPRHTSGAAGTLNWLAVAPPAFTVSQFSRIDGDGELQFGAPGSPITIGFSTADENGLGRIVGFDNFAVMAIPLVSADFDKDDDVDGSDFLAWQREFRLPKDAAAMSADANHDGQVDELDLAIWGAAFGIAAGASNLESGAPEPSAATLAAAAFLGVGSRRRWRRR
jgi:hypothetical protein